MNNQEPKELNLKLKGLAGKIRKLVKNSDVVIITTKTGSRDNLSEANCLVTSHSTKLDSSSSDWKVVHTKPKIVTVCNLNNENKRPFIKIVTPDCIFI